MVLQNLVRDCQEPALHAPNHNPAFFGDESPLVVGTRALAMMAINFLAPEACLQLRLSARCGRPSALPGCVTCNPDPLGFIPALGDHSAP